MEKKTSKLRTYDLERDKDVPVVEFIESIAGEKDSNMLTIDKEISDIKEMVFGEDWDKPDDMSGSPGSNKLVAGDMSAGYFGTVEASELWTGEELAEQMYLTNDGMLINNETPWLKFALDGEILFTPMKPIRKDLSRSNLLNMSSFGRNVQKESIPFNFKIGLFESKNVDSSTEYRETLKQVALESMWNRLMLPLHINAKTNMWSKPEFAGQVKNWGVEFTNVDLDIHPESQPTFCAVNHWTQVEEDFSIYFIARGGENNVENIIGYGNEIIGCWRPILKLDWEKQFKNDINGKVRQHDEDPESHADLREEMKDTTSRLSSAFSRINQNELTISGNKNSIKKLNEDILKTNKSIQTLDEDVTLTNGNVVALDKELGNVRGKVTTVEEQASNTETQFAVIKEQVKQDIDNLRLEVDELAQTMSVLDSIAQQLQDMQIGHGLLLQDGIIAIDTTSLVDNTTVFTQDGKITTQFPITPDEDFNNGRYIGTANLVSIPKMLNGQLLQSYNSMFAGYPQTKPLANLTILVEDSNDVAEMQNMFSSCKVVRILRPHLNTSNMTSMREAFYRCEAETIDLSNFDTSKVTDMENMFRECKTKTLNLSHFDMSSVTNIKNMFYKCAIEELNLSGWNLSNITSMKAMFDQCDIGIIDLSGFDTSKVTDMGFLFEQCTVKELDLSSFDTSEVAYMGAMFKHCKAETLDLSSFDTLNVITMASMFYGCQVENLDLSNFDTSNAVYMSDMFQYCKAKTLDLSSFDTSNVTRMEGMFYGSYATELNLSSFDTSEVTHMTDMFRDCETETLDLSSFNTPQLLHMNRMFWGCKAETIDLSNFDTSKVTAMTKVFQHCKAKTLDLSSFDTSNVTRMEGMFWGCKAETLDLSSFDTSKVTDMDGMFYECAASICYVRTEEDAARFDQSFGRPNRLQFIVKEAQ